MLIDLSRAVGDYLHHRLLAVNVLTCLHRGDRNVRVPVVRGSDDDGIDVLAGEHFPIVASGKEPVSVDFAGARQPAVIKVADRDQLDTRNRLRVVGIAHTHSAETDGCDTNAVVGRSVLLRRRESGHGQTGPEKIASR